MGVPFKRLLHSGVVGGLTYTLFNIAIPSGSLPAGVLFAVAVLALTGMRGGIPLWQRLIYRLRGSLLLFVDAPMAGEFC